MSALSLAPASFATIRIVNNNVNSPAQYTNLQPAIDASALGDTVYVQGSASSYGAVTINKKITLIGAGYAVTGTQSNLNTTIGSITLDTLVMTSPPTLNGIRILGCNVSGLSFATGIVVHSVVLERNMLGSINIAGNGWIFRNNVIGNANIYLNSWSNYVFSNNVFAPGRIYGNSAQSSGVLIANNIFLGDYSGNSMINLTGAQINNNIFWYNSAGFVSNMSGCIFNNNMTYGSTPLSLPVAGNSGSGNLNNVNPNFVNVPSVTVTNDAPGYDYSYLIGSQAINSGTDGSNLGVTGGAFSSNSFTGIPPIPVMTLLDINNPIINQGQQLNVHFKAKKAN